RGISLAAMMVSTGCACATSRSPGSSCSSPDLSSMPSNLANTYTHASHRSVSEGAPGYGRRGKLRDVQGRERRERLGGRPTMPEGIVQLRRSLALECGEPRAVRPQVRAVERR